VRVAPARFDHILAMTDGVGTFEHADHLTPRREHGYCTDDVARVLVVVAREPDPSPAVQELGRISFRFLAAAQGVEGHIRNRRDVRGRWHGRRGVEDCWGRALWAFGAAASGASDEWVRQSARSHFAHSVQQRSPWPRSMAFAALGAADLLAVDPDNGGARLLLADAVTTIGPLGTDPAWPWPEARLTYANAALAEALVTAGDALDRPRVLADGLTLLGWLLDRETLDGHLSLTPVGGSGPGDRRARFDQQPIEAATLADACARAATVTGDPAWLQGVELAARWFAGDNDAGAVMWDAGSRGGYDGLHAHGPNLNQGAESTLALISTLQHASALSPVAG
jgi:hypothetical protein